MFGSLPRNSGNKLGGKSVLQAQFIGHGSAEGRARKRDMRAVNGYDNALPERSYKSRNRADIALLSSNDRLLLLRQGRSVRVK